MMRRESLAALLDRVLDGDLHDLCPGSPNDEPWSEALAAVGDVFAQRFERAAVRCGEVLDRPDLDEETRLLAQAALGMSLVGWPIAPEPDEPDHIVTTADDLDRADIDEDLRTFLVYLLVEAALACGRLTLARALTERFASELGKVDGFLADDGKPHPFHGVIVLCQVRLLAFSGLITQAQSTFDAHAQIRSHRLLSLMYDAAHSFVLGNADDKATVRRIADALEAASPRPDSYYAAGCYTQVAYALIAIQEIDRCARFVLLAGQGPELASLTLFDRALGLELLVAAAVATSDLDAAEAWQGAVQYLADAPAAATSIRRLNSRVELLSGRPATAAALAQEAIELCRADGRVMEGAESEIVLSRCKVALAEPGAAARLLEGMVAYSDEAGHAVARIAAAKELRAIGRRLRPTPGSEWAGLSPRERDVALMLAEGLSNRQIASELYVSEHTVRGHVSRVLAAFGTSSRTLVAVRLAEHANADLAEGPLLPSLTAQQRAVADLIAKGLSNATIAAVLGVTIKTVEKHVSDILVRWSFTSRVAVARAVVASRQRQDTLIT